MGVTELWSILSPVRECVPLYSLTGKTLAVDLSLWICEAQHIQAMMGKVTKPHLRNLFFRTSSLLRMGVKLVFVMEGEAPKIKAETMSKRIEMVFRGSKTKSDPKAVMAKNTGRGRFKAVLREGLVDGCITSDGDAFLYGAQTVYRNFNMSTKGVAGVGKEQTLKLIQNLNGKTLLQKKTLSCDKFPFTEIICEFLVPKDKVVHSFRRRKPNLLLMQNFALDKMEWPKHYTSEKVLALMTYAELMNKRHGHGTEILAQIQPIRIYKRRIRNGISCFEVLWRKPDHYVFPEDRTPEEPDVVSTVEEETLFSVAFPDIAQLFHKENNSKRKKPTKAQKEKPADSSDIVTDLFAQMSLQTSTEQEPSTSSEMALLSLTNLKHKTYQCTTATLDAPQPSQQSSKQHEIQREVPPSPCPTSTCSQNQSSPSMSAVLNELHLSSIDWDALSFTASPCPQPQYSMADLRLVRKTDEESRTANCGPATTLKSEDGDSAVPPFDGLPESPVRQRVIMRDMMKYADSLNGGEQSAKTKLQNADSDLKNGHTFNPSCKLLFKNQEAPPISQVKKSGPSMLKAAAPALKEKTVSKKAQQPKVCRPPHMQSKYTFVKPKHSSMSSVLPQRSNSDFCCKRSLSGSAHINHQSAYKRGVSIKQGCSSEDNEAENSIGKDQIENKFNVEAKCKPDIAQRSVLPPHSTKQEENWLLPKTDELKPEHPNQMSDSDTDDSDVLIDSPRPLAERLKLKFTK
ncbi:hypothetical protein NFI96_001905 [Prochilodus magdalenae]|nr:hypothetical protein NFI96_001905 [Prochilodus magdalenae]